MKTQDEITRNILENIRRSVEQRPLSESEMKQKESVCQDDTRMVLEAMRKAKKGVLKEEKGTTNAIAITDDSRFGNRVLSNQIAQFRTSVDGGAQFSTPEKGNVADSPLIYMPDTGNLIFSGIIPRLNNLKWQFVLKTNTGNGCFVWSDGMIINKENMQTLNKLYGFYRNWCDEWWSSAADLEKIANNFNENR